MLPSTARSSIESTLNQWRGLTGTKERSCMISVHAAFLAMMVILFSSTPSTAQDEFHPENDTIHIVVTSGFGGQPFGRRDVLSVDGKRKAEVLRGGASLLATFVRRLKSESRAAGWEKVVLIDTGSLVGDTGPGDADAVTAVYAMNLLGYAAVMLGERDRYRDDLAGALKQARFTVLGDPSVDASARPFVVTASAGLRIGIVGATVDATNAKALGATADEIVRRTTAARANGASLVIVTVHVSGTCAALGHRYDRWSTPALATRPRAGGEGCDRSSTLLALAHEVGLRSFQRPHSRIDAMVGGHGWSRGVSAIVNDIPVAAPTADGLTASVISLSRANGLLDAQGVPLRSVAPPEELCSRWFSKSQSCAPERPPQGRLVESLRPDVRVARAIREAGRH
jgi:hypothetical protein